MEHPPRMKFPYAGVLLGLLLWTLIILSACANEQPHWDYRCTKSELVFVPTIVEEFDGKDFHTTTTLSPRPQCSKYDSTWIVPDTTRKT